MKSPNTFGKSIAHGVAALIFCASISSLGEDTGPGGFAIPQSGAYFVFPRDHGNHPEFKLEWWYVTGHLFATTPETQAATDRSGRRFGFQATFFRRAAPRSTVPAVGSTNFASDQLFLAHMALLDTQSGRFIYEERLNRNGWDAQSATETLDVRNGNWSLKRVDEPSSRMQLQGSIRADARLQLELTPVKPLVVFGTNGVSRKGAEVSAASHYLTYSRLATRGTLRLGPEAFTVAGESWMDHEFSSSQLGAGQVGWDWACVQLNDGREIMVYRLRQRDGGIDPFSTLAWVDRAGAVRHWPASAVGWEVLTRWVSPRTQAVYPSRIRLTAPASASGSATPFILEPLNVDQELVGGLGGIPYWEGACRVRDATGAEVGQAFLELTGYAGHLRQTLEE